MRAVVHARKVTTAIDGSLLEACSFVEGKEGLYFLSRLQHRDLVIFCILWATHSSHTVWDDKQCFCHDAWHIPSPLHAQNHQRPRQDREHAFLLVRIVTIRCCWCWSCSCHCSVCIRSRFHQGPSVHRLPSQNITSPAFDTCIACPLYASDYLLAFLEREQTQLALHT
jgi:hypothetical protein